jgi:hypothetical protein
MQLCEECFEAQLPLDKLKVVVTPKLTSSRQAHKLHDSSSEFVSELTYIQAFAALIR